MANLDCLLVCTFGNILAPTWKAAHTVNNLDLGKELHNEGYESGMSFVRCHRFHYPHLTQGS